MSCLRIIITGWRLTTVFEKPVILLFVFRFTEEIIFIAIHWADDGKDVEHQREFEWFSENASFVFDGSLASFKRFSNINTCWIERGWRMISFFIADLFIIKTWPRRSKWTEGVERKSEQDVNVCLHVFLTLLYFKSNKWKVRLAKSTPKLFTTGCLLTIPLSLLNKEQHARKRLHPSNRRCSYLRHWNHSNWLEPR